MNLPFKFINLDQIVEIGLLTDVIRAHYARQSDSGFHGVYDLINQKPPEAELKRKEAINALSPEARQELIAILFFARRADRNPHYWEADLRYAGKQLGNPNILDTDNLHDYIKLGLEAFGTAY
ncbi:MAG: DUF3775 domain-containing protein [Verrucomicrobiae bacterium]|nr:DUF3775 domain-containing protein [Verrucomicrobiae bacterium]